MKLGVSYCVFDAEELLEGSIKQIRDHADHINVVYQTESYFNNSANPGLEDLLHDLQKKGLIDTLYHYKTNFCINPQENQKKKRNIGLNICKKHFCTHFMNLDCDEFYVPEQIAEAKKFIEKNKVYASATPYINYVKDPTYRLKTVAFAWPFIFKINLFSKIRGRSYFPFETHPVRKLNGEKKFKLFMENEVVLHHMWTVRKDMESVRSKFENISMRMYKDSHERLDNFIDSVDKFNFEEGKPCYFNGEEIIKVPNQFNINF